jgi:hypothetical protein
VLRACTYYDDTQDVIFDTDAGKIELRVVPGTPSEHMVMITYARDGAYPLGGTFATATHGTTGVVSPDEVEVCVDGDGLTDRRR